MINELKSICDSLDGYSSDDIGFMVVEAKLDEDSWLLSVKPYSKTEKEVEIDSCLLLISDRLLNKYSERVSYKITFASEDKNDCWCIKIKKVENEKDNSEEREE